MSRADGAKRGDIILLGRVTAGIELLARGGATDFELAHEEEPIVLWWAGVNFNGHRKFSEKYSYPAQAVEDVLSRTLNGGTCVRCGKTVIMNIEVDGLCSWFIRAEDVDDESTYRYIGDCEPD